MYVLDQYEPKGLSEFIIQDAVDKIEEWYRSGHNKPLLISGPIGIGKSTLVRLFAKQHGFALYELTPSDKRDKESIEKQATVVANSQSVFGKPNLLFFDNIDVFFRDDKGGLEAIAKIAKNARNPVIFVAQDIYADKKLQKIREISQSLVLKKPSYLAIFNVLKKICIKENIYFEEQALKQLAKEAEGDLRSSILDLDFLKTYGITSDTIEYLGKRERKYDVFKTVIGIFKAKTLKDAMKIRDASNIDFDMLFNWIVENLHLFYESENLKKAYEFASIGDLNRARIYVRQNWTFLKYYIVLGMLAPALYPNKDHFSFRINYPTFIRKMTRETSVFSKNKKAAAILQTIILGSKKRIIADMEFYKLIFSDEETFKELTKHINEEDKEFIIDYFGLPKKFKELSWTEELLEEKTTKENTIVEQKEIKDEKKEEIKQKTLFSF